MTELSNDFFVLEAEIITSFAFKNRIIVNLLKVSSDKGHRFI